MKFQFVISIFAALVVTSFAMDQPSFHTKGTPTGKPADPLRRASTGGNHDFQRADRWSCW
jgi:hypothetical protein